MGDDVSKALRSYHAGNSQGIYLKHRDNGAGNPLPTVAVVGRLYVNITTYPLPG